jgi:hypothetical protein
MIIRRVGVWSVSRMYGAVSAVGGLLGGLLLAGVALFSASAGSAAPNEDMPAFLGPIFGIGAVIFLPIFYGVLGILAGAIGGGLYNLFAGMVGGIEIDVT